MSPRFRSMLIAVCSTGAAPAVPLPDAIANEATAIFRRSAKQAAERFQWSCRLQIAPDNCF